MPVWLVLVQLRETYYIICVEINVRVVRLKMVLLARLVTPYPTHPGPPEQVGSSKQICLSTCTHLTDLGCTVHSDLHGDADDG